MSGKKITYYTLTAFIIGCIVLTYVQLGSSRNISALIDGNQQLMNEFKINDELKILEKNIFSVESNIRGVISTSDMELYDQTDLKIEEIHRKLDSLYVTIDDAKSKEYLIQLDTLVNRKLAWGRLLLKTYRETGKSAAEKLIGTKKGLYLTDSISSAMICMFFSLALGINMFCTECTSPRMLKGEISTRIMCDSILDRSRISFTMLSRFSLDFRMVST